MNTEHCKIFVTAVRMKNMTRAAEKLGYTQSGISKVLARMETEFGFPLIRREHEGISLLPEARPVYEKMVRLLSAEEDLNLEIARMRGWENRQISLGTFHTIAVRILPDLIRKFMKIEPEAEVKLKERSRYEYIRDELLEGTAHLGFLTGDTAGGLSFYPLFTDPYYVIVPAEHPLAGREKVAMVQLKEYPLILPDETACSRELLKELKKERLSNQHIQMKVLDDTITLSLVEKGFGISFVPGLFLSGKEEMIKAVPFEEGFSREIGVACRSREFLSPMERKFLDFLCSEVQGTLSV